MIYIMDLGGIIRAASASSINQGESGASEIVLLAPYPSYTSVRVNLQLPNKLILPPVATAPTGAFTMAALTDFNDFAFIRDAAGNPIGYNAWKYTVQYPITQSAGNVTLSFVLTSPEGVEKTSTSVVLPINRGTPSIPQPVSEDDLTIVAAYVAQAAQAATNAEGFAEGATASQENALRSAIRAENAKNDAEAAAIRAGDAKNDAEAVATEIRDIVGSINGVNVPADLEIDSDATLYKYTFYLVNEDGEVVGTKKTIDLPLESVVVGGEYDDATQQVILTLDNGETIAFSVADLVEGLVSTSKLFTVLADYVTNVTYRQFVLDVNNVIDHLEDNKVTRVDTASILYATDTNGNPVYREYGTGVSGNKIVRRTSSGAINVQTTPTDAIHAASKAYVDKIGNALDERVTVLESALISFEQDDSAEYKKTAPLMSSNIAYLNSIRGKAIPSKNLLNPALWETFGYTVNSDGTVTPNKTVTQEPDNNDSVMFTLPAGTYTLSISGTNAPNAIWMGAGGYESSKTITLTAEASVTVVLEYGNGTYSSPLSIMVNEGDTALPFSAYYAGYKPAAVTAIKTYSANLIPFPYTDGGVGKYEKNRVTFEVLPGGAIKATGTATGGDAYFFVGTNVDLGNAVMGGGGTTGQYSTGEYSIVSRLYYDGNGLLLYSVGQGSTENNIIYPMANKGSTLLPYRPYFDPITFTIPTEITSLPGYGYSMPDGSSPNELDFDAKTYTQRCAVTGNTVTLLSTPVVTDVSEYLDRTSAYQQIQVQGGGEIEFINELAEPVSSTITYLLTP